LRTIATHLDRMSGYFFTAGFFISRARILPFVVLNSILNIVSLLFFLIGYAAWFTATLFYPNHPRRRDAWYGFAEFKEQFQIAAVIGTGATLILLTYPPLLIPALWLFATSNFLWSVGEYHKKENPPDYDQNFSTPRQEIYLKYAYLMTSISLISASASTIAMCFPPAAPFVMLSSTVVGTALTIVAFTYWQQSAYGEFPPNPERVPHSYANLAEGLEFSLDRVAQPAEQFRHEDVNHPHPIHKNTAKVTPSCSEFKTDEGLHFC
jgi:hypothetical protein